MDLLPKMGSEDLDEWNLQSWNFAVQENTRQIQLNLETDVDIGSVNSRTYKRVSRRNVKELKEGYLLHQRVNRRLGIWLSPDLWAFVNFLNFIDSSKPLAFSQNRPSHDGNAVALNKVCSRMVSTPPSAWITSVRYAFKFHSFPSWRWLVHQNGLLFINW